jgi:protein-tyrosine phosphatase
MIDLELYGGRRPFVMHVAARAMAFAGIFAALAEVDWSCVHRLVFVCKGNICRSPYAATRARQLGLNAVSFGFDTTDGGTAHVDAIRNAARREVDLSTHRSQQLRTSDLRGGDLVMLFEPWHLSRFASTVRRNEGHIATLVGLWTAPRWPYIADPYGKSDRYFQQCFTTIDSSIRAIAPRLRRATA